MRCDICGADSPEIEVFGEVLCLDCDAKWGNGFREYLLSFLSMVIPSESIMGAFVAPKTGKAPDAETYVKVRRVRGVKRENSAWTRQEELHICKTGEYVNMSETARRAGLTRSEVRRAVLKGKLPSSHCPGYHGRGGRIIAVADIQGWLETLKKRPTGDRPEPALTALIRS